MLRLFDPSKYEPPKPWIVRVLADNESHKCLGLSRDQWLLNTALWAAIVAVVLTFIAFK